MGKALKKTRHRLRRRRQEKANRKLTEEELLVQELSGSEGEEADVLRDFSDVSSEEDEDDGGVSDAVAMQVAVTKAKLAAMAFEESEQRKRRDAKKEKAERAKEKKRRGVVSKLSAENAYAVRNACDGCGESMSDAVPFKFDGKLYCSPACLRQATKALDESVARRSQISKVKFDHSTEKRLQEMNASKRKKKKDARDSGQTGGITTDSIFEDAKSSKKERRRAGK
jgi:hypothetical protein